ncbi:MAG: AAA family ATPase [Bacillaceae bacterium]|nr:AAA family ATPase [Bacillaceae bacterium]
MIRTGVRWLESETRKIFNATKKSDELLAYLDSLLFHKKVATGSAESFESGRKQGRMTYYKENKRFIVAAPRKKGDYIHVVLTIQTISRAEMEEQGFKLGNQHDIYLYNKEEIERFVDFLNFKLNRGRQLKLSSLVLKEWIKRYIQDEDSRKRYKQVNKSRFTTLEHFKIYLEQLKSGDLSLLEFKKNIDQLFKTKHEIAGEKINIWGFSGFSGQMFFNQICNQVEHAGMMDELTNAFLEAIELPEQINHDFSWVKHKFQTFIEIIKISAKKAIENGFPPQKCAKVKFSTFFLSFFWGIQDLYHIPIYYRSSRDALEYLEYPLNQNTKHFDGTNYIYFAERMNEVSDEVSTYLPDDNTFNMLELEHFLHYVKQKVEEQKQSQDEIYTLSDDLFAERIKNTFIDIGIVIDEMSSSMGEETDLPESHHGQEVWRFSGKTNKDAMVSYLFCWDNPDTYLSTVYEEDEEGASKNIGEIGGENEDDFLRNMKRFFIDRFKEKKPYTLEDAVGETYIEKKLLEEWLELLSENKQIIFYGPPGTGKTLVAKKLAKILAQHENRTRFIQFHPSYTYEEFIEGLRPELVKTDQGTSQLSVKVKPGIFKSLCKEASKPENKYDSYVLIIDEINRANTAKVFGELLYALEYRDTPVPLPYSNEDKLIVPSNVYLIGTMNTTDRSLAHIDFALRRRFQFIPFFPEQTEHVLKSYLDKHQPEMSWVFDLVKYVNQKIEDPHYAIGHSYFMGQELTEEKLERIWKYQIIPYLEECFVHQPDKIEEFKLETLLENGEFRHD